MPDHTKTILGHMKRGISNTKERIKEGLFDIVSSSKDVADTIASNFEFYLYHRTDFPNRSPAAQQYDDLVSSMFRSYLSFIKGDLSAEAISPRIKETYESMTKMLFKLAKKEEIDTPLAYKMADAPIVISGAPSKRIIEALEIAKPRLTTLIEQLYSK